MKQSRKMRRRSLVKILSGIAKKKKIYRAFQNFIKPKLKKKEAAYFLIPEKEDLFIGRTISLIFLRGFNSTVDDFKGVLEVR